MGDSRKDLPKEVSGLPLLTRPPRAAPDVPMSRIPNKRKMRTQEKRNVNPLFHVPVFPLSGYVHASGTASSNPEDTAVGGELRSCKSIACPANGC